jgi:type I restriction enzyme S subunit
MVSESLIGLVPDDWEQITLGEICSRGGGNIQTGPFGSQLHASDYVPVGVPSIMPQNIGNNRIMIDGIARIKTEDAERLGRYRVRPGDVVYSRRGDVERRALIRDEEDGWLCGTGCLRVRFGEGAVDPLFASYYLGHPSVKEWIVRHAVGATMLNLNTSILSALPFVAPPLPEQKFIAQVIGAFDDKIELNRRMNATLEQMAQALFKSWFVDFDPVKAKAEGRAPEGMDADTAALFPSEFEESELGPIPKGWGVQTLEHHTESDKGLSYKGAGLSKDGGLPMHNLNSIYEGGGYKHSGIKYYTGEYKDRHIIYPGEIIVANTEQGFEYKLIGYPAIVPKAFGAKGIFTHHIFRLRPVKGSPVRTHFLYYLLMTPDTREQIIGCTNGTTVNALSIDGLRMPQFVLPCLPIIELFESNAMPLFSMMEQNLEEKSTLSKLRDDLLPKLISGRLRIPEAEAMAAGEL